MKHICILILSFLLILLIGEKHAARYGNALLKDYHTMQYGLKLTYANYYCIVDENRDYYLSEGDTKYDVDSIVGYSKNKNRFSLYIYSGHKPMQLDFTSYDMVKNRTPIITYSHSFDKNTIFLREEPTIIYYWRAIAFVLILATCAMTTYLLFYFLRVFIRRVFP